MGAEFPAAGGGGGSGLAGPFTLATSPPLVAAFGAPVNPGTSTIQQGAGGDLVIEVQEAVGVSARLYPLTGSYLLAKRLRVCLVHVSPDTGPHAGFGIFFRRTINGRFISLMHRGPNLSWVRWTDPFTPSISWSVGTYKGPPYWLDLYDNGAKIVAEGEG